jgi:hypothetical protein
MEFSKMDIFLKKKCPKIEIIGFDLVLKNLFTTIPKTKENIN